MAGEVQWRQNIKYPSLISFGQSLEQTSKLQYPHATSSHPGFSADFPDHTTQPPHYVHTSI